MKLIYDLKYRELVTKQIKEQIKFLLQNNNEFSIVVHMDNGVDFNPELPDDVKKNFKEFTIFAIAGYTFKSTFIENDTLIFEAGFGSENIGAMVYIDMDRILQIIVGDSPIFINITASVPKIEQKDSSFNVFASNPKNKKFFKK